MTTSRNLSRIPSNQSFGAMTATTNFSPGRMPPTIPLTQSINFQGRSTSSTPLTGRQMSMAPPPGMSTVGPDGRPLTPQQQQQMMMMQADCCMGCTTCFQPPNTGMPVDPYICMPNPDGSSMCNPVAQMCDCGFVALLFFTILSIIGFISVVSTGAKDTVFNIYDGVVNTSDFDIKARVDIPYFWWTRKQSDARTETLFYMVPCNQTSLLINSNRLDSHKTIETIEYDKMTRVTAKLKCYPNSTLAHIAADPAWTGPCVSTKKFYWMQTEICVEDGLRGAQLYTQLFRWLLFRATLYFLAMCFSVISVVIAYIVYSAQQQEVDPTQFGMMPIRFLGTNYYYVLRFAWTVVAVVVIFWAAGVLYEYCAVMDAYKTLTVGSLHSWFVSYEKRFIGSTVPVLIYLCWPLCHVALEIVIFIVGILPWFCIRNMCRPGVESIRYTVDTPLDDIPGCVRLDMFFMDFSELKRWGFSVGMWSLLTGSYREFFECCPTMIQPQQLVPCNRIGQFMTPMSQQLGPELKDEKQKKDKKSSKHKRHHSHSRRSSHRSSKSRKEGDGVDGLGSEVNVDGLMFTGDESQLKEQGSKSGSKHKHHHKHRRHSSKHDSESHRRSSRPASVSEGAHGDGEEKSKEKKKHHRHSRSKSHSERRRSSRSGSRSASRHGSRSGSRSGSKSKSRNRSKDDGDRKHRKSRSRSKDVSADIAENGS